MSGRVFEVSPRDGVASDPLLGWCVECGRAWEADSSQPMGDEVDSRLIVDRAGAPLDRCYRCGASADARTGPRLWAERLFAEHGGELRDFAHNPPELPADVVADASPEQMRWWRTVARKRWEEIAPGGWAEQLGKPEARLAEDLHDAAAFIAVARRAGDARVVAAAELLVAAPGTVSSERFVEAMQGCYEAKRCALLASCGERGHPYSRQEDAIVAGRIERLVEARARLCVGDSL
jgi:hypothetical protein